MHVINMFVINEFIIQYLISYVKQIQGIIIYYNFSHSPI